MTESERKATSEKYYQELRKQLDERIYKDKRLNALSRKIMENAADFNDTAQYSELVSNHIAAVLQENIGEIASPLAKEFVCTELLKDQHSAINETLGKVQVSIDEKNGIHINPQKATFPLDRVKQVAHALEDTTVSPETIKRRAGAPVANVSKSFHDSYMKENAKFRNDAGLKCYIVRMGTNCCTWCSEVAGKYKFGEQPDDIFRRHDNCDCTIIYGNQVLRGKQTAEGGRTKTWEQIGDVPTDYQPAVFTPEQAKAIEQRNLQYRGLTNDSGSGTIESEVNREMNLIIDKFTPCLENTETGELVPTVYERASKNDLLQLKDWNFNWLDKELENADIYKLCVSGDKNIQGLVAVTDFQKDMAVYVNIAESAPHNLGKNKKFNGVGGHLFAIAAKISLEKGYGGFLFMDAKNTDLVKHYSKTLNAVLLGRPHPYRMFVDEENAIKLLNTYTFEEG